ncbi:MAG: YfcC family protein, partial [Clostridia bacterium]|nr:YfcC family protein [Clostridia bacterium]
GDGFTNLLYPTSGIMIIAIGMVGVSYRKWLKFTAPLFIAEFAASVIFMLLAIATNYA